MDLTGEYRIPADKQRVWQALNDPSVLQASIPNCESIEKLSDTEMRATVNAKVGPLKAKFDGKVTLSNLDPPHSYTLSGEGQGAGGVGFAKGSVDVKLTEGEDGATVLSYAVSAQVGGKLAQIGSRLIDSVAQQQAKLFFAAFVQQFEAQPTAAEAPAAPALPAAAAKPDRELGHYAVPAILFVVMLVLLYFHATGW